MRSSWVGGVIVALLGLTVAHGAPSPALAQDTETFHGLTPARLVDTRPGASTIDGQFQGIGRVEGSSTLALTVVGRGGVPQTGVGAVALNVTVADPLATSYLTVYPTGQPRPTTSNLNFTNTRTTANSVVVSVGADGQVSFFNGAASFPNRSTGVHLVVDVLGWFPSGSSFTGLAPARFLDTRAGGTTIDGSFSGPGPLAAGATRDIVLAGRGGVPANAGSVALNLTAVDPADAGYVTAWPTGQPRPTASNLNFVKGINVPNMVIVPVGSNGSVSLYNGSNGPTNLLVDVLGWFPTGSSFTGVSPARVMDTRRGAPTVDGRFSGPVLLEPGVDNLVVRGRGGVPAAGARSVILNVTVVEPTDAGYLTVYPLGVDTPNASNLNFTAGQTVANAVIVPLGSDGQIQLRLDQPVDGSPDHLVGAHVIVDVLGWFSAPDVAPNVNEPWLRIDGLGATAFGTAYDEAMTNLAPVIGEVTQAVTTPFPTQLGPGRYLDADERFEFAYPVGREVCSVVTCLVFGGEAEGSMQFVGWSTGDYRFLDANGLGVGARITAFPEAIAEVGDFSCGNGRVGRAASGLDFYADYSDFDAPFQGLDGYEVQGMSTGDLLVYVGPPGC